MHKGTMMGLCLMAVLGAVVLEVNASPDTDPISMLPNFGDPIFEEQCMKKTENLFLLMEVKIVSFKLEMGFTKLDNIWQNMIKANDEKSWDVLDAYIDESCKKATEVHDYFKELTNTAQVCLTSKWKHSLETLSRILESLARFQCSLSRNEVAPYLDTMGMCPNFTRKMIDNCDQFLPNYPSVNNFTFTKTFMLFFSPTSCAHLHRYESCVLHLLEICSDNPAVKMVQSIFNIIKNETDCQELNAINVTDSSKAIANNNTLTTPDATASGNTTIGGSANVGQNTTASGN
ncbi:uncharacterized protein [Drosophila bipectinata]|uniref:uncharacterized protein n=1 Tax=Drosophila bipectinata TaxID=42026 RepID=UPI001C8AC0C1|nr:uncharacterized protein LOC108119639 [Drosophila bipectinata]